MILAEAGTRAKRVARALIASHGRSAQAIALATAAVLLENGQGDFAMLWQQVARAVSTLLAGDSAI
ncbi:MAG TPA: hypothetical protein VLV50_16425 [Stellaceae bacterium]|nr:hypothetical protein [Stellaceae bacterium]